MSMSNGVTGGNFTTIADLQASEARLGTRLEVITAGISTVYSVDSSDLGSAVLLDNGLFANPAQVASIADLEQDILELRGLDPNDQTGTAYTLLLTDADKGEVFMNNASANILTIPTNAAVAFAIGTVILITQEGAGITTVTADSGVTMNGIVAGSGALTQYSGVAIKKRATDTWLATPLTVA